VTHNEQGFAAGVELVFRLPTAAADKNYLVEVKN
jgi:hypothetical protein